MSNPPTTRQRLNGPINSISCIISNVMDLSTEAEIGATHINGKEAPNSTKYHSHTLSLTQQHNLTDIHTTDMAIAGDM